jgi:transcriptional regulator with XRE-family HTH domain
MARPAKRSIHIILGEARRALGMSQEKFGSAIGSSHRSAVRWDAGRATPAEHQLRTLAGLLHPVERALAAEVAAAIDETLESLGLEAPRPPAPPAAPSPPAPPALRPADLIEIVVLAVVEHAGVTPAVARQGLYAAFKRAREIGLTVEVAEKALRPAAPPAQGTAASASRGAKPET